MFPYPKFSTSFLSSASSPSIICHLSSLQNFSSKAILLRISPTLQACDIHPFGAINSLGFRRTRAVSSYEPHSARRSFRVVSLCFVHLQRTVWCVASTCSHVTSSTRSYIRTSSTHTLLSPCILPTHQSYILMPPTPYPNLPCRLHFTTTFQMHRDPTCGTRPVCFPKIEPFFHPVCVDRLHSELCG